MYYLNSTHFVSDEALKDGSNVDACFSACNSNSDLGGIDAYDDDIITNSDTKGLPFNMPLLLDSAEKYH